MTSQIASELEDTVRRVPIVGWVALAGGAALIVLARHHAGAAAVLNPNAPTPDASAGANNGALPGQVYPPSPGVTPGTTPDPGGTAVVPPPDYHQRLTDIMGGDLGHFLGGLTNQADYVSLTQGDTSLVESSGVATFGGGNGTALQAPDWLRAQGEKDLADAQGQAANTTAWGQAQAAIDTAIGNAVRILNPGQGYYDPLANRTGPPSPAPAPNPTTPFLPTPTPPSPTPAPTPSGNYWGNTTCNRGNYSCIRYACHPGDTACGHSVASWWRGDPISNW